MLPVTLFYAGLFSIFAIYLSARAGAYRGKSGISVLYGDPPDMELATCVRVHQNFLEYVPLILIMMGALEINGANTTYLLVIGAVLLVCRIAHLIGLKHDDLGHIGRLIGAGGTALTMVVTAGYALWIGAKAIF